MIRIVGVPRWIGGLAAAGAVLLGTACTKTRPQSQGLAAGDAASRVYVPPGSYDEFYAFFSGGYSGQVNVYGLPSGRLIKEVPVFSQFAQDGYGYDED
ncbi:MAG TPA: nitrous oxide reductase, partial [Gemmatimonadaceae bacterium]|nr:nitrous oxide reductase [Gemmatimonadaceae bacterium]